MKGTEPTAAFMSYHKGFSKILHLVLIYINWKKRYYWILKRFHRSMTTTHSSQNYFGEAKAFTPRIKQVINSASAACITMKFTARATIFLTWRLCWSHCRGH